MRVLLVDNSKPECAISTPKLHALLAEYAQVQVCKSRKDTIEVLGGKFDAIVLSGSSLNMSDSIHTSAIAKDLMILLHFSETPILGVCFGMQLLAVAYGGLVERLALLRNGEFVVDAEDELLSGKLRAFFHHQDAVTEVPPLFKASAYTDVDSRRCVAMMRHVNKNIVAVQFHPEFSAGECRQVVAKFLSELNDSADKK